MWDSLNQPFFWGLAIGLIVAGILWLQGLRARIELRNEGRETKAELQKEIEKMREHLHRQMEISAKGSDQLHQDLIDLKKQNENLRITVATLQNKPGRAEIRTLEIYERAVQTMNSKAPGFAGAWQAALAEAEQEMKETEGGLRALVRKVFRSAPGSHGSQQSESQTLIEREADSSSKES